MMNSRLARPRARLWLGEVGCLLGRALTPVLQQNDEKAPLIKKLCHVRPLQKASCCHSQPAKGDGEQSIGLTDPRDYR